MSRSDRDCEACGEIFTPRRSGTRFCRDEDCLRARSNARVRKWYGTQSREKLNDIQKEYRTRTGKGRDLELKRKYGITLDQWLSMVSYSGGCEICGKKEDLCVDHDHLTSEVRGVLCRGCNRSIGQLGDSSERMKKAYEYLKSSQLGRNVPRPDSSLGTQEHLF